MKETSCGDGTPPYEMGQIILSLQTPTDLSCLSLKMGDV